MVSQQLVVGSNLASLEAGISGARCLAAILSLLLGASEASNCMMMEWMSDKLFSFGSQRYSVTVHDKCLCVKRVCCF